MIKCRLTRIFNPECNLSICSCVYVADQFNMDKSKLNLGANVGDIPRGMTGQMYNLAGLGDSLMTRPDKTTH